MKCEEVDRMMIDYLDFNLREDMRREIENHLETCERCIDELKDIQQVMNLVSKDEMETPDDSLRINFYHMLHSQIKNTAPDCFRELIPVTPWYSQWKYRVAAAVALLVFGSFIGMFVNTLSTRSLATNELKQLQTEVTDLKKSAMFTMLKEESSSDRIQAVSYAGELGKTDENVINVLVETLNKDKNVSVRMAAAYALSRFADQKEVTDSLVKSLSVQTDPILQVTLINILAERKEKSAAGTVQKIIANKNTLKEVRAVAENSLRVLI